MILFRPLTMALVSGPVLCRDDWVYLRGGVGPSITSSANDTRSPFRARIASLPPSTGAGGGINRGDGDGIRVTAGGGDGDGVGASGLTGFLGSTGVVSIASIIASSSSGVIGVCWCGDEAG